MNHRPHFSYSYLLVLSSSSIVLSLFSITVSLSSISLSILPSSSSLGPKCSRGGLNGVGCGSIGIGRRGSYGLRGSNLIICHFEEDDFHCLLRPTLCGKRRI